MRAFTHLCSLAFISATLLATGGAHLVGLGRYRDLLREHGVLPGAFAAPLALIVTSAELAAGLAAAVALLPGNPHVGTVSFATAAGLGGAFAVYLRRLVRAGHTGPCGCSPLEGRLTPVSFVPAGSLVTAGAVGLLTGSPRVAAPAPPQSWTTLAIAAGLTLAGLVLLLPASVPRNVREARQ